MRHYFSCLLLTVAFASPVQAQDEGQRQPATDPDAGTITATEPESDSDPAIGPDTETDTATEPAAEPDRTPEPEPEPTPEPTSVSEREPEPAADRPTCSAVARDRALDSVVRIRSGSTWGAGFVYHSRRHVVTAFSLIALGQGATVVTRDGAHFSTRVLARDETADLAILELDEEIDASPLEPAPETSAMVGRDVVAMGHPFAGVSRGLGERGIGLLRWSVSRGQIAASNDSAVQADIALTAGHAGGPLLDCEGLLVGMITGSGILSTDIGLVVRTARIDRVIRGAGEPGDFLGDLRPQLGIGAGMLVDEQGSAALGIYLTLGAVLFDRISLMNRVGLFMGGDDSPVGDEVSSDRQLIRIESLLGYRFFVDVFGFTTAYIVPAGGLVVSHDRRNRRRAMVTPGCMPGPGMSCITFEETSDSVWLARPALGLSFLLFDGHLEVGYTIEIGTDTDPVLTYHAVRLGLFF